MSDIREKSRLRSSRFVHFCISNFLLHAYVFLLIPFLIGQCAEAWGAGRSLAAWAVCWFAVGTFLPGAWGAYLMERYSRKNVALWSVLALGLFAFLPAILPQEPAQQIIPYGLQGVSFGLAQIALGSTLVNDVLLSCERDRGDILYAWAGRLGIPVGLLMGILLPQLVDAELLGWYALAPCALAFLLIASTSVPIKAPVPVSMVSLDRFLLPRSLYLSLSLFAAPFVLGSTIVSGGSMAACLFTVSFVLVYALQVVLRLSINGRAGVTLGFGFIVLGLFASYYNGLSYVIYFTWLLIGAGVSLVSAQHMLHWITLAKHCQRGTAQNTYLLSWRVAFSLGFACAYCLPASYRLVQIALCIVSLCFYLSWPQGMIKNRG